MAWKIFFHNEFNQWFDEQDESLREAIASLLDVLEEEGPQLGRPYVDTVAESIFPNMKELRVQHKGDPWRILFAFDFERAAILLVGGETREGIGVGTRNILRSQIDVFKNISINFKDIFKDIKDGELNDFIQGKTATIL